MDLNAYGENPEGQNLGGKPHSMAETTPVLQTRGFSCAVRSGSAHNDVMCKKAAAMSIFAAAFST